MEKKKVLLGMSGGVDSSVSALILKKLGYEVVAATLELICQNNNKQDYSDVKNICDFIECI